MRPASGCRFAPGRIPSSPVRNLFLDACRLGAGWSALLWAVGCAMPAEGPASPIETLHDGRRAILVSVDGLNETQVRTTLPAESVASVLAVLDGGSCAAHAITAFPSLTAPSLSATWTGAWGDVTGVTANTQPRLPRNHHTLLDRASGFSHEVLRAEPLWVTAAREGRTVVAQHVTQAPEPAGFPAVEGEAGPALRERRGEARAVLDGPRAYIFNGYNRMVADHRVHTATTAPPSPPGDEWQNLDRLEPAGVPPLEIVWEPGEPGDSVFALLHGADRYTAVTVARSRDVAEGVRAELAPAETDEPEGRRLARRFSGALEIPVSGGGRIYLRLRLFELEPDGSDFLIYQPPLHVVQANRPDAQLAYDRAVRGWVGNAALPVLLRGGFGPMRHEGGDGTAELRFLETLELVTRQYMRGAEWAWYQVGADLLLDYFPSGDQLDHELYSHLDPGSPHHDPETASLMNDLRARGWGLVGLRVAHLRSLVAGDPDAALFLVGDHGMRPSWKVFSPNAALAEAGLLVLDDDGEIDLARTKALSPNGYWINVNTTDWKGGIVPPQESARVLEEAEGALHAARDGTGDPVVTALYRPEDHPELGIGGPAGGDLYFGTAPGIRWTSRADVPVVAPARPWATHGYPPADPDMFTVFCADGTAFPAGRTRPVRVIDVAPTVAEWLGAPPPRDAVGRSVLDELRGS
jgi:hypothetical protein